MFTHDDLLSKILKRTDSLFEEDIKENKEHIHKKLNGATILVVGAAGSIGSAVVDELIRYNPYQLDLVDISENGLVEVIRKIRSSEIYSPPIINTYAIDMRSEIFREFMYDNHIYNKLNYDFILNFSAMKHVRSEKDPYTFFRMFDLNTYVINSMSDTTKMFSVSSDKAVRPTSAMGATKQIMERLYYWQYENRFSTTRFANVAFSAGSLLDSFRHRVANKQPLFTPMDVERYFISHKEAAQLCILSFCCGEGKILVPKLPKDDLLNFKDIAELYVREHLYKQPMYYDADDLKGKREHIKNIINKGRAYPIVLNKTDTSGEKLYEEFFTEEDTVDFSRFKNLGVLDLHDLYGERDQDYYAILNTIYKSPKVSDLEQLVPDFQHIASDRNLDERA